MVVKAQKNVPAKDCKPKKAGKSGPKLTPEAKHYVLMHLALGYTARYIINALKEIYEISITHQAIFGYRKTESGKAQIAEIKSQLVDKYMEHLPVANMVNRIAYAQELVNRGLYGYQTDAITKSGDKVTLTIVNPNLIEKGVALAQKELGTKQDEGLNDALRKSGTAITIIDYGKLPEDECKRLGFEWAKVFGPNGNGSGNSRF